MLCGWRLLRSILVEYDGDETESNDDDENADDEIERFILISKDIIPD